MSYPIDPHAIVTAARRLTGHVRRTPTLETEVGAFAAPVTLKLELLQHTGSFKARGAFNRVLTGDVPEAGLIAASGGNHGLAVAHVATTLDLSAEIFVPESSPAAKVDRLRRAGPSVSVTVTAGHYAEAQEASTVRAQATGALVVHPYDQPEVIAGQGTMARELDQQVPGLDTVLVAVGGGGLIAGAACWFRGRVTVVAVEPERSCALHAARAAGRPVDVDVAGVAADSLGARRVGELAFAAAAAGVQESILVGDDAIRDAQRRLWEVCRLVAEPGGATALAAITSGVYRPAPGERVAVVVCGGNTDPATVVG